LGHTHPGHRCFLLLAPHPNWHPFGKRLIFSKDLVSVMELVVIIIRNSYPE